jgi:CheY-like chemotaxis protein
MPAPLIAVVDDEPIMLDLFADTLGAAGYRVVPCDAAMDAYACIKDEHPDLVILPLWIGKRRGGGWELCQALADDPETAAIPLIMCTGMPAEERRQPAQLQPQFLAFVDKPFNIADLLAVVKTALAS